jgi:hypothetical protein
LIQFVLRQFGWIDEDDLVATTRAFTGCAEMTPEMLSVQTILREGTLITCQIMTQITSNTNTIIMT